MRYFGLTKTQITAAIIVVAIFIIVAFFNDFQIPG